MAPAEQVSIVAPADFAQYLLATRLAFHLQSVCMMLLTVVSVISCGIAQATLVPMEARARQWESLLGAAAVRQAGQVATAVKMWMNVLGHPVAKAAPASMSLAALHAAALHIAEVRHAQLQSIDAQTSRA